MPLPEANDALPVGTLVGEFMIKEVIGVGGFGIVYRAWEPALEREVALKEYMPIGLVARVTGGQVALRTRSQEADFLLGLRSFVNEARLLARFDNPALVKVHRFWEMNGTAYMAMPFYRAQTLRQRRQDMGLQAPTQAWLLSMIEPLLGALAEMHRSDVYHRDIAPDNILWCDDSRPVLLDFGAARHVLADRTQTLTAILKPQFAPIEQYADSRSMRQGPWTDVFALASTCYFMLTGRPPVPATARILSDELTSLLELAPAGFSTQVLATLDWAMSVRPEDRPQSVAAFWDALHGHLKVPMRKRARQASRELHAAAPGKFERTVQTSSSTNPRWESERPSGIARLLSMITSVRPALWLLVVSAGLSAGASIWLVRGHGQPQTGVVSSVQAHAPMPTLPASAEISATASPMASRAATPGQPLQADVAWADAHEASAPVGARLRAGGVQPKPVNRHPGARAVCRANESSDVDACMKRLCKSDSRFARDESCAALSKPAAHWWQFGKSS